MLRLLKRTAPCASAAGLTALTQRGAATTGRGGADRGRGATGRRKGSSARRQRQARDFDEVEADAGPYDGDGVAVVGNIEDSFQGVVAHLRQNSGATRARPARLRGESELDAQADRDREAFRVTDADGRPLAGAGLREVDGDGDEPAIRGARPPGAGAGLEGRRGRAERPPRTQDDAVRQLLRRDLLNLTGTQRSGARDDFLRETPADLGGSETTNNAPGDQTIPNDATKGFGDVPPPITDMVHERLLELKAAKLEGDRARTFAPRRHDFTAFHPQLQRSAPPSNAHGSPGAPVLTPIDTPDDGGTDFERLSRLLRMNSNDGSAPGDEAPESGDGAPAKATSRLADVGSAMLFDPWADEATVAPALEVGETGLRSDFSGASPASEDRAAGGGGGKVLLLRAIQRAGFASRRSAQVLVSEGCVRVNSAIVRDPFHLIAPEDDVFITSHRQRLRFEAPRLWIYHKPTGTRMVKEGPGSVLDFRKHAALLGLEHLIPVGSLPTLAHGIVMLTNDGDLSRFLSHPRANVQSTWLLRVKPAISPVLAVRWNTEGVRINGVVHRGFEFNVLHSDRSRYMVKVKTTGAGSSATMRMGTLMEHLGRKIVRGGRVSVGPYMLRGLSPGTIREVTVPPFYMRHINPIWSPFIERDWGYFRARRIHKLKALSRIRPLSEREREELDAFTFEELQQLMAVEADEVEADARELSDLLARRPPPIARPDAAGAESSLPWEAVETFPSQSQTAKVDATGRTVPYGF